MRKTDGRFGNEERSTIWEVKKTKIIDGIWIPILLEGKIIMNDGVKLENKVKQTDFLIKIPVGTIIEDNRKNIVYEADGVSDNMEESLATALEAMVKKAKTPKEQSK